MDNVAPPVVAAVMSRHAVRPCAASPNRDVGLVTLGPCFDDALLYAPRRDDRLAPRPRLIGDQGPSSAKGTTAIPSGRR